MAQVAFADRLTLPPDSTGKPTGMFAVAVTGGTLYLPASVLTDTAGNAIDSATGAPAGTERGLITRNIPSGTQPVSGTVNIGTAPQVAVNNVETLTDNAGFTDGTSKVFPQGYVFDETAGTALTENDVAAARVDSKRAVVNVIEDGTTRGVRATVKAASTPPATTDTAQVVALSPNSWVPRGQKRYQFATTAATTALATTTGEKPIMTIWHPATTTATVYILELILWWYAPHTAGALIVKDQFISAENGTPGGTTVTAQQNNRADVNSGVTIRTTPAAPTKVGTLLGSKIRSSGGVTVAQDSVKMAVHTADEAPIVLRGGVAEGYYLWADVLATLTGGPQFLLEGVYEEA